MDNDISGNTKRHEPTEQMSEIYPDDSVSVLKDLVDQGILSEDEFESWNVLRTLTGANRLVGTLSEETSVDKYSNRDKNSSCDDNCVDSLMFDISRPPVNNFEMKPDYALRSIGVIKIAKQDVSQDPDHFVRKSAGRIDRESDTATDGSYSSQMYHILPPLVDDLPIPAQKAPILTKLDISDDRCSEAKQSKQQIVNFSVNCTNYRIVSSAILFLLIGIACVIALLITYNTGQRTRSTQTNTRNKIIEGSSEPTASGIGTVQNIAIPDLSPALSFSHLDLSSDSSKYPTPQPSFDETLDPTASPTERRSFVSLQSLFFVSESLTPTPNPT